MGELRLCWELAGDKEDDMSRTCYTRVITAIKVGISYSSASIRNMEDTSNVRTTVSNPSCLFIVTVVILLTLPYQGCSIAAR